LKGALGDVVFQPPPPPPTHDPLKLEIPSKAKDDSSAKDYVPSLFLAATAEGTVYRLRLRDGAILNRVRVWRRPVHLALLYREVFHVQVLLVTDAASKSLSTVPLPLSGRGTLPQKRGKPISALGMTPDAGRVYVATPRRLYVVNPFWWRIAQRLKLPHPVDGIFAARDGRHLVLTDSSTGKVFGVDLGNRYAAWRLPGVVFALLLFAFCALMAQSAGRSRFEIAAILILLTCDPLLFALSRMAMNDIYLAAFVMGAYFFCFRYTQSPSKRAFFWAMSVCFGLGLASKWPAVCALGGTFLFILFTQRGWSQVPGKLSHSAESTRDARSSSFRSVRSVLRFMGAYLLLPFVIYAASFTQTYLAGSSPAEILHTQKEAFTYHATLKRYLPFGSKWWQWPFDGSFELYHEDRTGMSAAIWLMPPAVISLAGLFALPLILMRTLCHRDGYAAILCLGFFGQWLPWAISPRQAFLYHFASAVPFLCLAVAYFLGEMRAGRILSRLSPEARSVFSEVYLGLVIAAFVWLHPELTTLPGDFSVSHRLPHPWMRGWIPVTGSL